MSLLRPLLRASPRALAQQRVAAAPQLARGYASPSKTGGEYHMTGEC